MNEDNQNNERTKLTLRKLHGHVPIVRHLVGEDTFAHVFAKYYNLIVWVPIIVLTGIAIFISNPMN